MGVGDVEGYEQHLNIHPRSSLNGPLPPTVLHQLIWTLKSMQLLFLHGLRVTTADHLCPEIVENGYLTRKDVGELLAPLPHQVHYFIKMLQAFNRTLKLNETVNGITKYYDLRRNS